MNAPIIHDPLVSIKDLTVELPRGSDRDRAVEQVDLSLARGRVLCVVGESGSGKSMTAHAIMGLVPKPLRVSGSIRFQGTELVGLPAALHRQIRGERIGMIFQEPMAALNPVMRVGKQIEEVFRFHGINGPYRRRIVDLLAQMGLPDPELLQHAYPFRLSGGQRQRVMIAMALALDPDLLIADEPTTALDVTTQKQILALLKQVQARSGMGIMLITHDFGVVTELGDDVVVMQQGRIVERGSVADVLTRPKHSYTRTLLSAVPRLEARSSASESEDRVEEPLMQVSGISKTFGGHAGLFRPKRNVRAVDDVGFTLEPGKTLGIVGESGSGKSTLARILVRLISADQGEVRLTGVDGNFLSLSHRELVPVRKRVQMIFQDPFASLNPRRTVFEIIAQGLLAHGMSRHDARARVDELLDLVALDRTSATRFPNAFSGGQRQRIGIARALAMEPDLIVADEPVSALDVSIQARVLGLLSQIQKQFMIGMIFITHDLRVAAQVSDHVAVMKQGRIVETGSCRKVLFEPEHAYTRLLIDSIPGRDDFVFSAASSI